MTVIQLDSMSHLAYTPGVEVAQPLPKLVTPRRTYLGEVGRPGSARYLLALLRYSEGTTRVSLAGVLAFSPGTQLAEGGHGKGEGCSF